MRATLKTVLSGLIGIRRGTDHEHQRVRPLALVATAVVLAALFIFTLLAIVRIVTG